MRLPLFFAMFFAIIPLVFSMPYSPDDTLFEMVSYDYDDYSCTTYYEKSLFNDSGTYTLLSVDGNVAYYYDEEDGSKIVGKDCGDKYLVTDEDHLSVIENCSCPTGYYYLKKMVSNDGALIISSEDLLFYSTFVLGFKDCKYPGESVGDYHLVVCDGPEGLKGFEVYKYQGDAYYYALCPDMSCLEKWLPDFKPPFYVKYKYTLLGLGFLLFAAFRMGVRRYLWKKMFK